MDDSSYLPPEVSWVFREVRGGEEAALVAQLTPEERLLVGANAASKRLAEFGLGRACGREALRLLGAWPPGGAPPSILRRDRTPVWPAGIVGSIAHSHGAAVAAVAYESRIRALGVDLERLDRKVAAVGRRTLRPEERDALTGKPDVLALLVFCVKEAVFKSLNPLTGVYLGFQDARVNLPSNLLDLRGGGAGALEWELLKACGEEFPAGYRGRAGWAKAPDTRTAGWLMTGVWVPV